MTKSLYPRLAVANIKNQAQIYIPYMIAASVTVMMFFLMSNLSRDEGLSEMSGGATLKSILAFGTFVVSIIAVIVLLYVNSFIIKRRIKEFGLFNVLGMEKRHIALVASYEVFFTGAISLFTGLLFGILLSKLTQLLLTKLIKANVTLGLHISIDSIIASLGMFTLIFVGILIYNVIKVFLTSPTELLNAGNVGEREPKTRWLMTILGILCLGGGYYLALTTDSPLDALGLFFLAVLLVIIGTYLLFTSVSIAILKVMRRNKGYYYQTKHFISVSGMIYRMKRNAAGLATICILATSILIMISTTLSLYLGYEDVLRNRFPQNVSINARNVSDEDIATIEETIDDILTEHEVQAVNIVKYKYLSTYASFTNGSFTPPSVTNVYLFLLPLNDYNQLTTENITLASDEILFYSKAETEKETNYDFITFGNTQWQIAGAANLETLKSIGNSQLNMNYYYVILPNESAVLSMYNTLNSNDDYKEKLAYDNGFDLEANSETQISIANELKAQLGEKELNLYIETAETSRADFYATYGGLFFLGIFLGIIFMLYTVLIIYYKQITEGYEDKERFNIMQKVGMSREMVRKTIKSQVVSVFFLPLLVAAIHVAAAFRIISQILLLFNLSNVTLFVICTICTLIAFTAFYAAVYVVTAREYYKIVKA